MGEVYRATDTNLKRAVAIKVLPESVAGDRERLARFQREAEVLASLNHPNIAAIYGLERSDGMTSLVMELVEGPTLGDRIAQGPIPVDEALPIAKQIAEGLEAAHEQGIMGQVALPQFNGMMAEVLHVRSDFAAAERWLKQAIEFEHSHDDRYFSAEVHRLSAICRVKRGRIDEACSRLHEAIDVARSQGAATFELRAALSLADVDPQEGRLAVRKALTRFPEPEPWPEIASARAL
jgi:tetratricopeptide (TPR) repeat protein